VRSHLPKDWPIEPQPGPEDPGPFSLGDRLRVQGILEGASFSRIAIDVVHKHVVMSEEGIDAAVHFAMTNGPAGRALREAPEETKARVRNELLARLPEWETASDLNPVRSRYTVNGVTWEVTAVNALVQKA
jgi:hypothetical protein